MSKSTRRTKWKRKRCKGCRRYEDFGGFDKDGYCMRCSKSGGQPPQERDRNG